MPRREILLSQLLTLHLDLALRRYKGPSDMSKFDELAAFTEETLADFDVQAQGLLETGQKLKARGNAAFQKHRDKYAKANAGMQRLEEAVRGVEGDNLPKQAEQKVEEATGSGSSSNSFPVASNSFPAAAIHSG
jgi:hypothetical protein